MSELTPNTHNEPIFQAAVLSPSEIAKSKEFAPVLAWYTESCNKLPEMHVDITPVKDAKTTNVNPDYFSYANVDITTPRKSWQQGGIMQHAESLSLGNSETIDVHGVTILLTDPDGRTFVTVSQEPMANAKFRTAEGQLKIKKMTDTTEIHPVVRSPLQSSAEKLKRIARSAHEGLALDPSMTIILARIATERGQTVQNLLGSIPLSESATDGNRLKSNVLYGNLTVPHTIAAEIAKDVRSGRWVTPAELDALTVMGVTNGNLNIGRSVTEAQRRLSP